MTSPKSSNNDNLNAKLFLYTTLKNKLPDMFEEIENTRKKKN